jgi:negative regulator of replication initiation
MEADWVRNALSMSTKSTNNFHEYTQATDIFHGYAQEIFSMDMRYIMKAGIQRRLIQSSETPVWRRGRIPPPWPCES